MFDRIATALLDSGRCADALDRLAAEQRELGARRLALAARWADLHAPSDEELDAAESCDPRHPHLWKAVMAGRVEDWKARRVARACSVLTFEQAQWVDAQTVQAVVGLPFGRAMTVVEGQVLAADPDGRERRRREAETERFVRVSRPTTADDVTHLPGLRTLVARGTAGEMARMEAVVRHLADLLAAAGDDDPLRVRMSKAFGMLANPALVCVFLARSQDPSEESDPLDRSTAELAAELGRSLVGLDGAERGKVLDRLRPKTVLYLHLAEEAVRGTVEGGRAPVVRAEGLGPISVEQLREWLANDHVVVKPVIDLAGQVPVDAYEIPDRLSEATELLHPFEVFPWGTAPSRKSDKDHTEAHDPDGPSGQTRVDNLGPLARGHHRAKTFGDFEVHQPLPGLFLWRAPTGYWFRVDHRGTEPLGRTTPQIIEQQRAPGPQSRPAPPGFRWHAEGVYLATA